MPQWWQQLGGTACPSARLGPHPPQAVHPGSLPASNPLGLVAARPLAAGPGTAGKPVGGERRSLLCPCCCRVWHHWLGKGSAHECRCQQPPHCPHPKGRRWCLRVTPLAPQRWGCWHCPLPCLGTAIPGLVPLSSSPTMSRRSPLRSCGSRAAPGVCSPASAGVSSRRAVTREHAVLPNASVGQKSSVRPLRCTAAPADVPAHMLGTLYPVPTTQCGRGPPKPGPG